MFRQTNLSYLLFPTLCLLCIQANSQSNFVSSLGNVEISDGTICFSVGQLFYDNYDGPDGSVYFGLQQPIEIYNVTSVEEYWNIEINVKVYPNPAAHELYVEMEDPLGEDIKMVLLDMNGKTILEKALQGSLNTINLDGLVASHYFLKLISKNRSFRTFKIVKIN